MVFQELLWITTGSPQCLQTGNLQSGGLHLAAFKLSNKSLLAWVLLVTLPVSDMFYHSVRKAVFWWVSQ